MPDNIYIGKFSRGVVDGIKPFNIDNDAFPVLWNFYSWRGRVKKKRGTSLLGQLQIQIQSATSPNQWQYVPLGTLNGSGALSVNITSLYSFEASATYKNGSFSLSDGTNTYTDNNGVLTGTPGGSGTINYATGALTITGGAVAGVLRGTFSYYPGLPVMGLEDYTDFSSTSEFPLPLAFDTVYAYQLYQSTGSKFFYNISYYKYSNNPVVWTGQDYQLFWTTNYQRAFWATNNRPGMQFKTITGWTFGTNTITIPNHNLVIGDRIWVNQATVVTSVNGVVYTVQFVTDENNIVVAGGFGGANPTGGIAQYLTNIAYTAKTITGISQAVNAQITVLAHAISVGQRVLFRNVAGMTQINGLTGVVQSIVDVNNFTVNIDSTSFSVYGSNGVAIYLDSSSGDGIRWYDGDPTQSTGLPVISTVGWVNFAPPLTATTVSINNLPAALYYLVGAQAIVPYKNRLLFFSPWIQTAGGTPINLTNFVIWSWIGTPYYADYPTGLSSNVTSYYVDVPGKGGYLSSGYNQPILSVGANEDVLLVGSTNRQFRFVFTGNDLQPFAFFTINSEIGVSSPFSAISLDRGALTFGTYGIALTTQQGTQRIDLDIPDTVFNVRAQDNGDLRINAIRDFFREWVYFSFPMDESEYAFPTTTLLYNYRDNTWAMLYENYTKHGKFFPLQGDTWEEIDYVTWDSWNEPWESGTNTALFPRIIAGNPQGYVLVLDKDTEESVSGTINALTDLGNGQTQITSYNHCVNDTGLFFNEGDYLYFSGALGLVTDSSWNGKIGEVISIVDDNNFVVNIAYPTFTTTYLGGGQYTRLCRPFLQTKQFPAYWEEGRQVRLGVQKYLLDKTGTGQITLNIYLSQDSSTVWNKDPVLPNPTTNSSLQYTQLLYTCPESTNLGLTPANVNLQTPTAESQGSIWHRINTSLQGETVQIGLTLSPDQMMDLDYATQEITLHGIQLTLHRGPYLS